MRPNIFLRDVQLRSLQIEEEKSQTRRNPDMVKLHESSGLPTDNMRYDSISHSNAGSARKSNDSRGSFTHPSRRHMIPGYYESNSYNYCNCLHLEPARRNHSGPEEEASEAVHNYMRQL